MTLTIAGHEFPDGRAPQVCSCGRRLTDIVEASREDVGKDGIAHFGGLSENEYEQIERYREHVWGCVTGREVA